jgi:hypothetical protein
MRPLRNARIFGSAPIVFALTFALAGAPGASAQPRTVFVTSIAGNGDLQSWQLPPGLPPIPVSGSGAGNVICQALALRAGLADPVAYRAWLSDGNGDAFCRLLGLSGTKANDCGQPGLVPTAGPWARRDGLTFADSLVAITSGTPSLALSPARLDENGQPVGEPYAVWTGTFPSGTASDSSCANWESSSSSQLAVAGSAVRTIDSWTDDDATASCDEHRRLLCMQVGPGPAPPSPVRGGRFAFVTSNSGNADLGSWNEAGAEVGIAAGDAICRARALAGGLAFPETFKAWLSDDAIDARDRFTSGPWIRLDGFLVAESLAALTDGTLDTAIDRDELAAPFDGVSRAWTGTSPAGERGGENCANWGSEDAQGRVGRVVDTTGDWTAEADTHCGSKLHLYCLSDANPGLLFADGFESASFRLWSAAHGTP